MPSEIKRMKPRQLSVFCGSLKQLSTPVLTALSACISKADAPGIAGEALRGWSRRLHRRLVLSR
jgi:hypothetical protein